MSFEKKFFLPHTPFWIIASDEAGRGPLAGPVVAGSVAMRIDCPVQAVKRLARLRRLGIKDSKITNHEKRCELLAKLQWQSGKPALTRQAIGDGLIAAWSEVSSQEIDTINILQASLKAMSLCAQLVASSENEPVIWLVDGNRAPANVNDWCIHPVVDGDAKSVLIGLASVIAKDARDRLMQSYHELYPNFGLKQHMGYGTEAHRAAIAKYGPTPIHRQTFKGVREFIGSPA